MSRENKIVYMKITSNNGSTGYSWIIDKQSCNGILDITQKYWYYEPEENDGWDVGYGEEIFTLTALKFGNCDFRMAYARTWEWVDFRNHEKNNGYMIEIPITVLQSRFYDNDSSSGSSSSSGGSSMQDVYDRKDEQEACDPELENCTIKE